MAEFFRKSMRLEVGEFCRTTNDGGLGRGFIDGLDSKKDFASAFTGDGDRLPGMSSKPSEDFPFQCLHCARLR